MSENLNIEESVLRRIVHRFIEKEKAPKINIYQKGKRLVPFNITKFKFKNDDIISEGDTNYTDYNGNLYNIGLGGLITVTFAMRLPSMSFGENEQEIYDTILIPYNEYLTESRNEKIRSIGVTLGDKVRKKVDEYLGFDSDDLFPVGGLVRIFGGAVRDAISDREIHDVDILSASGSLSYIENILRDNGYKYIESLTPKDLSTIYNDIKVINEPHSWVKGDKIVQIIRPAVGQIQTHKTQDHKKLTSKHYEESFKDLIRNVDISCCGVSYDGECLYENYQSAVHHCMNGIFVVNKKAKMYSRKRIIHRTGKLESRGWTEVKPGVSTNRDLKIDQLLNEDNSDFIPEWKSNMYYSSDSNYTPDDLDDLSGWY